MEAQQFQLSFETFTHPRPAQLGDEFLSLGSCFAQRLGESLHQLRFPITLNPFGISFDALTIGRQLDYLTGKELPNDRFQHLDLWRHFDFHGSYSQVDEEEFERSIQSSLNQGRAAFQNSRFLVLTFGTAYFFRHKAQDRNVANCHKLPGTEFERSLASVDEMLVSLKNGISEFLSKDDQREVILSVSPVRHLSDGLAENNRSKARLIELCHLLCESDSRIHYFPSFEWLMDVLRDHRFYAEDMIHPSEQSVKLILEEFTENHFDPKLKQALKEMKKLQALEEHRILHTNTAGAQEHQTKTLKTKEDLKQRYPQFHWE